MNLWKQIVLVLQLKNDKPRGRWLRPATLSSLVVLSGILLLVGRCGAVGQGKVTSHLLSNGIQCLASQDWVREDLDDLGLRLGRTALIRYRFGAIPGISPKNPDVMNLVIYSPDERHGWMLFFRVHENNGVSAIRNGYRLTRSDKGWSAGEGNGGIATYAAVSAFTEKMGKQPAQRIILDSGQNGCQIEP